MPFANQVSRFNRNRKWEFFLREIQPRPDTKMLDVGFSEQEYSENDNFIEKNYPYPGQLTALGIDVPVLFKERYPNVTAVQYEGRVFPFPDRAFDVCWSNAVIEHVGDRERQVAFIKEIARVSKRFFITTPNRYFPIEVHTRTPFLHYLPKDQFDRYLKFAGKEWAAGAYMHLLSKVELKSALGAAGVTAYRLLENKLLGFPLDFVVIT